MSEHVKVAVIERASEVGGTWRDNTYPGAACEIRSDPWRLRTSTEEISASARQPRLGLPVGRSAVRRLRKRDDRRPDAAIRREFDVLIGGTGFNATEPSIARLVRGVGGVILSKAWSPHMEALRGTTVAGFPTLFLLVGPYSALGHNSIVHIIEAQIEYVLKALDAMQASGAAAR